MNILCTVEEFSISLFPDGLNIIKNPYGRKLTEEEVDSLIQEYKPAGIIAGVEPLTRRVLERADGLKIISRYGVGLDSIDLTAAKSLGIMVMNTPDAPTTAVAELTLGLILGILRHIHQMDAGIRRKGWMRPPGSQLSGKTVGIVGCGRIGTRVAKFLGGFDCSVIGYDPFVKQNEYIKMHTLEKVIQQSDIITLHIPLTPENCHIFNADRIGGMKNGALLINAGRGGLIDEEALYKALKTGKLAGAALDCYEGEPYRGPLAELDNVLLTCHAGSNTVETRKIMERQALENLTAGLEKLKGKNGGLFE